MKAEVNIIKKEIKAISADLKMCGEAFIRMADALESMFKTKGISSSDTPKPVTLTEVRKVFSEKTTNGFTDELKALIRSYGAEKLSDVTPGKYADLLAEAQALGGGGESE